MHIQLLGKLTSTRMRVTAAATLLAVLGIAAGSAATAHAALLSSGACDNSTLSQPFAAYGDTNEYKLVPGGDFESSAAGWVLSGGAKVVSGGMPGGRQALSLPAGAVATSPYTCVNASYPSIRLYARNTGLLSTVAVTLVYNNLLGLVALPALPGVAALNSSWAPSSPMLTLSPVGGLLSGGTAQVAIRLTSLTGSSQIDNVYVDPRMRY